MKKIILASVLALSTGFAAAAFVGPNSAPLMTTAADAAKADDDVPVVLEGYIVKQVKGSHYEFRDNTGTIQVEIDHDKWPVQNITPQMKVRLSGKVDRSKFTGFEAVDVKLVEIIK
ncbi:YgiW/YdeI family stress tolerance OB fold protein [Jeongeupia naejangsanensis]|uniref:NirD/YgiW/YdeI family stress tolerance protein n=1 Tax=Jeongeupia naejangsanensis TaxID=613195 RepID=A0ABS2BNL8_9NEIS|nr:NirD/YgiW/YdeI family stress tolerance protein [Jeongeupia naejangsanensis]MBM3117148.1 NirD/YgiW/YdeI family stress tolerance protein [Jeongeupia naejangsanensis]